MRHSNRCNKKSVKMKTSRGEKVRRSAEARRWVYAASTLLASAAAAAKVLGLGS